MKPPEVFAQVLAERSRQDDKWGIQHHSIAEWMMILTEEVGESAQAGFGIYFENEPYDHFVEEIIQVMAVCLAILESLNV